MTIRSIALEKPTDAILVAAPYAPAGPIISATSDTPANPSTGGTYVFRVNEPGLGFLPGFRVRAASQDNPEAWLEGLVTAFDGINLTIESDLYNGIGIYDEWFINVAGEQGQVGPPGPQGPEGPAGGMGFPDAPTDDRAYGRMNGLWVQVIAAANDVVDGGNFITSEGVF
jgi:hypothetical protein